MVRPVARTQHSNVYLVKHRQLGVYRIAKVVSGENADYERAFKEAHIIKNFKHTGIPLVYDIEVSGDSICIIEEYIAGKSLAEIISKEKLSVKDIAAIGVSICEVLQYLHNHAGICHMDIKPSNIIVRDYPIKERFMQTVMNSNSFLNKSKRKWDVCLIDFDSAGYYESVVIKDYGTVGYASPEQYGHGLHFISGQTDIYSVGMLLLYMLSGGDIQSTAEHAEELCELHSGTIGPIIKRCIRHNRSQRIKSIDKLKDELSVVAESKPDKIKVNNTCAVRDIYVYGTAHGVGTTHFCLCLAAFLNRFYRHKNVLCKRCKDREDVFGEAVKGKLNENGAYKNHGIYIMPDYGSAICCDESVYDIIVHDCGVDRPEMDSDSDVVFLCVDVHGYRKKSLKPVANALGREDIIFFNHISGRRFYELAKKADNNKRIYRMPCIYEWNESNRLFEEAVIEALGIKKKR